MSKIKVDKKLLNKLTQFSSINNDFKNFFTTFKFSNNLREDLKCIYTQLGLLFLNPEYTTQIVDYFPGELLLILFLTINLNFETSSCTYNDHLKNCIALATATKLHPDVLSFAVKYFNNHSSPFDCEESYPVKKKRAKVSNDPIEIADLDVVIACFTFLKAFPSYFRSKWKWTNFINKYYNHKLPYIKWISCHCIQILTGMQEFNFQQLLKKVLPDESIRNECSILHETKDSSSTTSKESNSDHFTALLDLSEDVIHVSGIYLPMFKILPSAGKGRQLVVVASTTENLRKIALGIAANRAISLQGPVGSGKTCLIEYLARKTGRILGNGFIKVQLGDQTDSKMLLGTYKCTDIPGEFVWQPGVLTQAVMDGHWLLLEDIDSASFDIASVLTALLENGFLTVPGFKDNITPTHGFQLFLTQRLITTASGHHKKYTNATSLLEKNTLQINIDPLTLAELQEIIKAAFPSLATIASRMVDVFTLFAAKSETTARNARLISTRDLFKWCARCVRNFDVSSPNSGLQVLQNAIDIFCFAIHDVGERLILAKRISGVLGIVDEQAAFFCSMYKPNFSLTQSKLVMNRATLNREVNLNTSSRPNFCFTRLAACLVEKIMCCVLMKEPVLLVGETGTGKTSAIQFLAHTLGQKLIVINMNQQSDSADLLGGYKPVDIKFIMQPILKEFETVFRDFFDVEKNQKFLSNLAMCMNGNRWELLVQLMQRSYEAAVNRLGGKIMKAGTKRENVASGKPNEKYSEFLTRWNQVGIKLQKLEIQLKHRNALAFAFVQGSLVKAIERGDWVLLDEINLANAETLECLSGLLESNEGSVNLLERGDKKPISRHPNFTLFACMNPSTDVGKRDLPFGLRNRFTEFFVEELNDKQDLSLLVNSYLQTLSINAEKIAQIIKFYLNLKREAQVNLSDGVGHKPHFSLRTLCRALSIASKNPCATFARSLYEAFCLSFLTQLNAKSYQMVEKLIVSDILGKVDVKGVLSQPIPEPKTGKFLQFEGYWVSVGNLEPKIPSNYILTASVRRNLKDLVRAVSIGRSPVLLQGDTSVGKTSLISYLAQSSGNKCVRINNHEHTDLQEYIGSYVADSFGKLVFHEGVLVEAMRKGHWIILDELNLAPTDVLEALNRVLDDNRELFITETQQIVKAHDNFMLFATQNPPGAYGGRKMLSRAFRNRFVELHFDEIPPKELEIILHQRCEIPLSYSRKMIAVMTDLQTRRRGSAAFAGKQGFITLRDLFRWGERYRLAQTPTALYDWDQHLADEGYLLLAGRVRKSQERLEIAKVLQKHMKREVVPDNLFTLSAKTSHVTRHILEKIFANKEKHKNIVWTYNMRQLGVLVGKAMEFAEPVLLVGETGGGKTTLCRLLAENNNQELFTVNCHMHSESSDFIGGLRPVRDRTGEDINKLFEWVDGPLVEAMQQGAVFLSDEISLADDSVLERLNSLLESDRVLLLAEKGGILHTDNAELLVAHKNFHFIGTMNPGGDYGKKELSPALRNRFTEIWCEPCTDRDDLIDIIEQNVQKGISFGNQEDGRSGIGRAIMDFIDWFKETDVGKRFPLSIRDVLTWASFINECADKMDIENAYIHGVCLTFLDSFGSGVTSTENANYLDEFRDSCMEFLNKQCLKESRDVHAITHISAIESITRFGIPPFYIEMGDDLAESPQFTFNAPTTSLNALRVLRGLQLKKPILLEGSPGVGKTSLVAALAKATRHKLLRINLSEQTDVSDLFGADLPVEGGQGGEFAWRDGPFLRALKQGHWILLDELNLASQSVLEGLNACLDHRGEIFVPELGKTFAVKTGTRLFACQNPLKQGGSRRGLPQSFLNRFTQVFINPLNSRDLLLILSDQFPSIPNADLQNMVEFNNRIAFEVNNYTLGNKGSPWEMNLRDLTRLCEATLYHQRFRSNDELQVENILQLIYCNRMRTLEDRTRIEAIFVDVFGKKVSGIAPIPYVRQDSVLFGDVVLNRDEQSVNYNVLKQERTCLVLRKQMAILRSLAYCVNLNWMAILVGTSGSGKSSVVKTLAHLAGKVLHTLPVTSAMDTTDILGGFEQVGFFILFLLNTYMAYTYPVFILTRNIGY